MKVKMPRTHKPAEAADYLCIWCDMQFHYEAGDLTCPGCGNSNRSDLVPIYVDDDPKEEQLYTPADWHGG